MNLIFPFPFYKPLLSSNMTSLDVASRSASFPNSCAHIVNLLLCSEALRRVLSSLVLVRSVEHNHVHDLLCFVLNWAHYTVL